MLSLAIVASGCAPSLATHRQLEPSVVVPDEDDADSLLGGLDTCPNQSTAGLSQCASKRYEQAAAEMTTAFAQVMDRIAHQYSRILESDAAHIEAEKRQLRQAQQAWEAFREANCETTLESGFDPEGTMHSVGVWQCMTRMTLKRTNELREYLRRMPIPPSSESPGES